MTARGGADAEQGLTARQAQLLAYLRSRSDTPSFEEMAVALGLKSKSNIHRLIEALMERGFIARIPNRARAIQVLDKPMPFSAPRHGALSHFSSADLRQELARRERHARSFNHGHAA